MKTLLLEATAKHPKLPAGTEYEADQGQALRDLMARHAIGKKRPKIEVHEEVRVKRKYRRRDMQAEN